MEQDYSKREIDEFMKDIKDSLVRIEIQTTKHNGRMSKLEIWQGFIKGGLAIVMAILLPLIFIVITKLLK